MDETDIEAAYNAVIYNYGPPVQWLKAKHANPKPKGKYKSGYGGNNRPARPSRPLTEREKALHAAQPVKVMRMLPNGHCVMVTVTES